MSAVTLLHEWVARHAQRRPEDVAIDHRGDALTYGELDALSGRIANQLRAAGCRRSDRVALLAPKSPVALAALLGIYKADAIGVPLDESSPPARLERVLRSSRCRVVLAGGGTAERLAGLAANGALPGDGPVGWIGEAGEIAGDAPADLPAFDFTAADVEGQPADAPAARNPGDHPAHVLFTSGSTGAPKGVVVRHSSVVHFVEWGVREFGIERGERLSGHSPLAFDLSTFDVFGAFAAGAELHLVPPELSLLPPRLLDFIRDHELTQWLSVPSVLSYIAGFDVLEKGDLPSLRRLLWCGETFPTPGLIYWMERLPHAEFVNLYGPTEATVASSFYRVPEVPRDERRPVPIGRACEGEGLAVLDDRLEPVPGSEPGELYIRGPGLSPGYWRDPRRTAEAFRPDPGALDPAEPAERGGRIYRTGDLAWRDDAGLFHLVGRADSQIKSRGYRIEPGEIEAAIAATGLAGEAVVTAVETKGFEGKSICCAFVPAAGGTGAAELRRELGRLLPPYMLPARWEALDRLPRNPNGKLDRQRIRQMFAEQPLAAAAGR